MQRKLTSDSGSDASCEQCPYSSIPGLDQVLTEFRRAFPELSVDEIERLFRLPPSNAAVAKSKGKGDR